MTDSEKYYVVTRMDGTSDVDRSPTWTVGEIALACGRDRLRVSTSVETCKGMLYPCRLFRVEPVEGHPVGYLWSDEDARSSDAWFVAEELPSVLALGPQGRYVERFIKRLSHFTDEDFRAISNSYNPRPIDEADIPWVRVLEVCNEKRFAAEYAISNGYHNVVWSILEGIRAAGKPVNPEDGHVVALVANETVYALIAQDLISKDDYDDLTKTWRRVIGRIHPTDEEI